MVRTTWRTWWGLHRSHGGWTSGRRPRTARRCGPRRRRRLRSSWRRNRRPQRLAQSCWPSRCWGRALYLQMAALHAVWSGTAGDDFATADELLDHVLGPRAAVLGDVDRGPGGTRSTATSSKPATMRSLASPWWAARGVRQMWGGSSQLERGCAHRRRSCGNWRRTCTQPRTAAWRAWSRTCWASTWCGGRWRRTRAMGRMPGCWTG